MSSIVRFLIISLVAGSNVLAQADLAESGGHPTRAVGSNSNVATYAGLGASSSTGNPLNKRSLSNINDHSEEKSSVVSDRNEKTTSIGEDYTNTFSDKDIHSKSESSDVSDQINKFSFDGNELTRTSSDINDRSKTDSSRINEHKEIDLFENGNSRNLYKGDHDESKSSEIRDYTEKKEDTFISGETKALSDITRHTVKETSNIGDKSEETLYGGLKANDHSREKKESEISDEYGRIVKAPTDDDNKITIKEYEDHTIKSSSHVSSHSEKPFLNGNLRSNFDDSPKDSTLSGAHPPPNAEVENAQEKAKITPDSVVSGSSREKAKITPDSVIPASSREKAKITPDSVIPVSSHEIAKLGPDSAASVPSQVKTKPAPNSTASSPSQEKAKPAPVSAASVPSQEKAKPAPGSSVPAQEKAKSSSGSAPPEVRASKQDVAKNESLDSSLKSESGKKESENNLKTTKTDSGKFETEKGEGSKNTNKKVLQKEVSVSSKDAKPSTSKPEISKPSTICNNCVKTCSDCTPILPPCYTCFEAKPVCFTCIIPAEVKKTCHACIQTISTFNPFVNIFGNLIDVKVVQKHTSFEAQLQSALQLLFRKNHDKSIIVREVDTSFEKMIRQIQFDLALLQELKFRIAKEEQIKVLLLQPKFQPICQTLGLSSSSIGGLSVTSLFQSLGQLRFQYANTAEISFNQYRSICQAQGLSFNGIQSQYNGFSKYYQSFSSSFSSASGSLF